VRSDGRLLSTRELLSLILHTASQLVSTEMALAREEGKANLDAAFATVKLLLVAGVIGLAGVNLLLVAAVFALAHVMPGWLAAVLVGGVILVISAIVGYIGWQRRVTQPLAVTRKTVTEDMQWVKERLA
jgi:apolipoprotein N-acyltransferase